MPAQAAALSVSKVSVAPGAGSLGPQLTIHQVRAAHEQLQVAAGAGSASIDVSNLESVDTAGLQLLLAASRGGIGDLGIVLSGGGNAALREAQQSLGLNLTFAGDGG